MASIDSVAVDKPLGRSEGEGVRWTRRAAMTGLPALLPGVG